MMLDADFARNASPSKTPLQCEPDIFLSFRRVEVGRDEARAEIAKSNRDRRAKPLGKPLAIMAATGDRWIEKGRPAVRFGDHAFDLADHSESLICLADPDELAKADMLEVRVHDLLTGADAPHLPTGISELGRSRASRKTEWDRTRNFDGMLSDEDRGLRVDWTGTRVEMHWWHTVKGAVFCEMDALRKTEKHPFMRTLLVRGAPELAAEKTVYRALITAFTPQKP